METKAGKGSILIVDDTPRNIQILGSVLKGNGFLVSVAQSGRQALDIAEKALPDLILLDIMMPEMDGFEVLEKLKRNKALAGIPVIFITAKVEKEDVAKGLELGAVDYITKPFNSRELLSRVTTHVKLKKYSESLLIEKDRAIKATKLKDKFVSLVAHDLRSPFNAILCFLRVVHEDQNIALHDRHKTIIGKAIDSSLGLLNMIDQLLDLSRLQTGNITLEPRFINVRQVCSIVELSLAHSAQVKGVIIKNEIPDDMGVFTDHSLFSEVIQNLLSNAIKFCRKGDEITLFAQNGSNPRIAIKDTGMGISENMLPDLFKQEEKTTTVGTEGEKGTGLGLPFCHEILQILGGSITVDSEVGKGSVFQIQLPFVKPQILIVEDEPADCKLIRGMLSGLDVDIIDAKNGKEAIGVLENNKPHLVILDIILPVLDGYETLTHIRQNLGTRKIPVIAITSGDKAKTREKAIQLGANDYINKPLKKSDLVPRVKRFISLGG